MAKINQIEVIGAREHNLKDISINIPKDKLVVITGVSGSGKSSLAFDTIYAEGQRRYVDTFSSYARQFLGSMDRPDVEKINGLSPVISIEQKTTGWNPRSTVGTTTEIYDFLRLLYARIGEAYSYESGKRMIKYSETKIINLVLDDFKNKKIAILAPVVRGRKGHYRELFEQTRKKGYTKVRVDGEIIDLTQGLQVDRYKVHDIEIVVDRIKVEESKKDRITSSIQTALKMSNDFMMIFDMDKNIVIPLTKKLMDPESGISYEEPSPNTFSFNSPYGSCKNCNGLGKLNSVDLEKLIPDNSKSIDEVGILAFGEVRPTNMFTQLKKIAKKYNFSFSTPVKDIPQKAFELILYGNGKGVTPQFSKYDSIYELEDEGLVNMLERWYNDTSSEKIRNWASEFMTIVTCPECNGYRLKKEALHFKLAGKNIGEISELDLNDLFEWFEDIENHLDEMQKNIARDILKEIRMRLGFLLQVGLDYLSLNRPARTLSGGEAQRTRLATQIGSQLTGITYILDEPSIGLHQRDNDKLIEALRNLTQIGNSVIVVEHDKDFMLASDYIIDLGPGAGVHGGKIVGQGTPEEFKTFSSITAQYLNETKSIRIPKERKPGNGLFLELKGAKGHNLQNINLKIPLGTFCCVTGVSGSGKSSLIKQTLYPILNQHFYRATQLPLEYASISGLEHLDKVIEIDQSPIGRTPRSNPATYTGLFGPIRNLYASLPEAAIRGYKAGRFSFNVKGGRCEECQGSGMRVIEMNFLPDVFIECEKCMGKRYNRETLEVLYKGKSISDVLDMNVETAVDFFTNIPSIYRKLKTLDEVGLGYITLGQQATTLSGGEAQRVKLAEELSKKDTGKTIYILDEPTTGLHFKDIQLLLDVLNRLVERGNTVLVIEHNLDVVKVADYVIDIGPDGGKRGGNLVIAGTPEKVSKSKKGFTSEYLAKELAV